MNPRPTHKELSKKLKHAILLARSGAVVILAPEVILADAMNLGYSFGEDFPVILQELLNLATPENYVGSRPPAKSYETAIKGAELFAFVIRSAFFRGLDVYFKFALYNDMLVVISLHEDR